MEVTVRLTVNVVGCGTSGEEVSLPSTKALQMISRGRAVMVGRKRPGNPTPIAPPPIDWPQNSGDAATRQQMAGISRQTGVKVAWIEAAANRIKAGDAIPTEDILQVIAERARLRKEVLALAEAYVIHVEMAERMAALAGGMPPQGGAGERDDAGGDQASAGDDLGAQGDVGGQGAPEDED